MYRPDKPAEGECPTTARVIWQLSHHWLGRATALLAIANIYYGIIKVGELGAWAWAVYTAILVAIVATAVAKESVDYARKRREAKASALVVKGSVELPTVQAMA